MEKMPKSSVLNAGMKIYPYTMMRLTQLGATFRSMEVPGCVLAVSRSDVYFYLLEVMLSEIEDFGLTETSYAVVRILQTFSVIKAGPFERPQAQEWLAYSSHSRQGIKRVAKERQKMTLVMSAKDGCPVQFER